MSYAPMIIMTGMRFSSRRKLSIGYVEDTGYLTGSRSNSI